MRQFFRESGRIGEGIYLPMTEAKRVNQIFQFVLNDFPDIFWCSGAAERRQPIRFRRADIHRSSGVSL